MKKYAIVTDSTTYFTDEVCKKNGINKASLNIIDGDQVYRELDVDNQFVYDKFSEGKKLTTSQPSPGEYLQLYQDLIKEGYTRIFVLVISEELSGTYQSAKIAMNMLDNPSIIHLFESNMAAFGNEMILLQLIKFIDEDKDEDYIISKIENYFTSAGLIFTTEDLVSLIRSGRLSKAKAMIGTVLRVKPIVKMAKGKLDLLTSSRTNRKALDIILRYMGEKIKDDNGKLHVRVLSHNSLEFALKLKEEIVRKYKNIELTFSDYIGPVFNLHLGPKGYGVSWMSE